MKTTKYIIILTCLCFFGCDELEDAISGDIDLPISFVMDINDFAIPEDLDPNAVNSFSEVAFYEVLSNPDVADVVGTPEQIKKLVINSVQYQYRNFSGNVDAIVSGQMQFITDGDNAQNFSTQPENVAEASGTTESFDLQGVDGVVWTLNSYGSVAARYSGNSTANPLQFDTRFIISATVTVEVNADDL